MEEICVDLPNSASSLQHVVPDEHVIHAPDFARWHWSELFDPYWEDDDPTLAPVSDEELGRVLQGDWDAIPDGFNCYPPRKRHGSEVYIIRYNIFVPGRLELSIHDRKRDLEVTLLDGFVSNLGIDKLTWSAKEVPAGRYELTCRRGEIVKTHSFEVARGKEES